MNNNITFSIELNEAEISTILMGLFELPAKMSMDIINNVRGQYLQQLAEMNSQNAGRAAQTESEKQA